MKLIIGNLLFAVLVLAWYSVHGDDWSVLIHGVLLSFSALVCGTAMAVCLNARLLQPRRMPRSGSAASAVNLEAFKEIR